MLSARADAAGIAAVERHKQFLASEGPHHSSSSRAHTHRRTACTAHAIPFVKRLRFLWEWKDLRVFLQQHSSFTAEHLLWSIILFRAVAEVSKPLTLEDCFARVRGFIAGSVLFPHAPGRLPPRVPWGAYFSKDRPALLLRAPAVHPGRRQTWSVR